MCLSFSHNVWHFLWGKMLADSDSNFLLEELGYGKGAPQRRVLSYRCANKLCA